MRERRTPHASGKVHVLMPMLSLVPGGMGGTETYARELTRHLVDDREIHLEVLLPRNAVDHERGLATTVVRSVVTGPSASARLTAIARAAVSVPARRRVLDADVVHYPFTVPVPASGKRPSVVTLHDVQHLVMPEFFKPAERAYRRLAYDRAARTADIVVTVSDYCKEQIVSRLGVPESRVHVIHLGVSEEFVPSRGDREEFVLYPARRWPHKNHGRLLEAIALLRRHRPELRLVLTGGGVPLAGAPAWVEQRGLVSDAELQDLYRRAGCMAFPSLFEGFGLPPLEAMASGCPVAVSTAGALPEVCGDAATSFDPHDVSAIAAAIDTALDGGDRLVEHGIEWAARFSWQRCADSHRDIYLGLAGR